MTYTTCGKCDGTGYIKSYAHIDGGRCYPCNGTGQIEVKEVAPRVSNRQREYEQYQRDNQAALDIQRAAFIHNAYMNNRTLVTENGQATPGATGWQINGEEFEYKPSGERAEQLLNTPAMSKMAEIAPLFMWMPKMY